jgi:phenylalanyl-tRNA synthetase alpha chain
MTTSPPSLANIESTLQNLLGSLEAGLSTADSLQALEALRVDYLGRNSELNAIRKSLGTLAPEDKPKVGALANEYSQKMDALFEGKLKAIKHAEMAKQLEAERIDVTMPGVYRQGGTTHPLTQVIQDITQIFHGMGYTCLDDDQCPEVETEHYNFEALNFPADHPARDMQDTFYTGVAPHVLLRSQTSNAQIRHMEAMVQAGKTPPIRVISPGRVYRNEAVSSRKSVLFHQIEGLCIDHVDNPVTMADLKGTLYRFASLFFGQGQANTSPRPIRFRGSYFPFTEPSVEVDVQCILCEGAGCRTCGQLGWLEVLGAGMVHPNVLEACGIDSTQYQGFAFGMGVERMAMLKYAIRDIRQFYTNDTRFLEQFRGA